jgi:hypothetical protein
MATAVARIAGVKHSPFFGDVPRRVNTALDRVDLDLGGPRWAQIDELSGTPGGHWPP